MKFLIAFHGNQVVINDKKILPFQVYKRTHQIICNGTTYIYLPSDWLCFSQILLIFREMFKEKYIHISHYYITIILDMEWLLYDTTNDV